MKALGSVPSTIKGRKETRKGERKGGGREGQTEVHRKQASASHNANKGCYPEYTKNS